MAEVKYAEWLNELFERGFYLSEFKELLKERFPDKNLNVLWRFIHRRRKQGWRIEIRREGKDTFYKLISKSSKRRSIEALVDEAIERGLIGKDEEGSKDSKGERVLCGMGVYKLRRDGGNSVLEVKVGSENKVVVCNEEDDVADVLRGLFGMVVEIKKVEKVGDVEKGVFGLYNEM